MHIPNLSKHILSIVLVFALTACFLSTFGQKPDEKKGGKQSVPAPVIVKANLLVIDAKQKPVSEINQSDIKVYEDGVLQQVTYFQKKEPFANIGLLFDNSGSMRESLKIMDRSSQTMVDLLPNNSEAFIIRFISRDKINILQEWTNDKV